LRADSACLRLQQNWPAAEECHGFCTSLKSLPRIGLPKATNREVGQSPGEQGGWQREEQWSGAAGVDGRGFKATNRIARCYASEGEFAAAGRSQ